MASHCLIMKFKLGLIVIIQFLFLNCKTSSTSKQDLINENKVLKVANNST